MLRYAEMIRTSLAAAGHEVTLAVPRPVLNRAGHAASGAWKWIGYVDKYLLNPREFARRARLADVVHICDHSNAVYVPAKPRTPYVVTCHDLLAIRGALGEDTDCPASFFGRRLQKAILNGLRRAQVVACVSGATFHDAKRLLGDFQGQLHTVPIAQNYAYGRLDARVIQERLARVTGLERVGPYVLHVGSNLRRKNRECVLRAFAGIASRWDGKLVIAGKALSGE